MASGACRFVSPHAAALRGKPPAVGFRFQAVPKEKVQKKRAGEDSPAWKVAFDHARRHHPLTAAFSSCSRRHSRSLHRRKGSWVTIRRERGRGRSTVTISFTR